MKKVILRLVIVIVVAGAAWGGYTLLKSLPQTARETIPTAKVRQGDVIVRTFARGELRAVRSVTLTAPNLFGNVQVTSLAALGSFAREKDLVAEFDDSELLSRLEEKQLEMEQVDEQMKKAQADLAIRDNQDQVELLRTRYSVRRAELEVQRNELLSNIDQKKNLLNLEESKRRLAQLESDIKSRREQAQAELAVLRERKNKAVLEMNREKSRLNQVKLLAPMAGLVAIRQQRSGFFMFGMQLPDIREGDQLQPGMPVADILDLSELEVISRIGELDRANLSEGQDVILTLDALAGVQLRGKIKSMSGTASSNIFSSDPQKKFDVVFSVDMPQLLTSLGASKEQINRIMAQAEANRKKPPVGPPAGMMMAGAMGGFGGGGGMAGGAMAGGGGMAGGAMAGGGGMPGAGGPQGTMIQLRPGGEGGAGGQGGAGGSRGGFGGGGAGFMAGLTDEQRQKAREIFQKSLGGRSMQDLSAEERQQVFTKAQAEMAKAGINVPARPGGQQTPGAGGAGGPATGGDQARAARREGRAAGGGDMPPMTGFSSSQFSEKDLANAKLPPPPEEDDQLEVLLRPGLLADVEIIVERIANAIHIPAQALFEKEGKLVAYVRSGDRFVPREVKPKKRSESMMILESGLRAGEEIALVNPEAARDQKKKGREKSGSPGGMAMPGGAKGGI